MGSIAKRTRRGAWERAVVAFAALAAVTAMAATAWAGPSDANGSTYMLTDFDFSTNVLSGEDAQGRSISAPYDAKTTFRVARLDHYGAADPCREAAERYNSAITATASDSFFAVDAALGSLAEQRCLARVIVTYPVDPIRPPSPIRSFEPRALPPSPI